MPSSPACAAVQPHQARTPLFWHRSAHMVVPPARRYLAKLPSSNSCRRPPRVGTGLVPPGASGILSLETSTGQALSNVTSPPVLDHASNICTRPILRGFRLTATMTSQDVTGTALPCRPQVHWAVTLPRLPWPRTRGLEGGRITHWNTNVRSTPVCRMASSAGHPRAGQAHAGCASR